MSVQHRFIDLPGVVGEKHFARIAHTGCHQIDPSSALRQPECPRIDHPIRPSIPKRFESGRDDVHRLSASELQHEWDVFQEYPGSLMFFEQAKYLSDQP
jgi:hypothetical protein